MAILSAPTSLMQGMRYLGDVLERGEQDEHRPELELARAVDLVRVICQYVRMFDLTSLTP